MWSEQAQPIALAPRPAAVVHSPGVRSPGDRLPWPKAALVVAVLAGGSWTAILTAVVLLVR